MSNTRGTRGTIASRSLVVLMLAVAFLTVSAQAEKNEWEIAKAAGIEAVKKSLEPLPASVKKYDDLLSGLDTKKIASIVTALDAYKERFQNAPQEERDKAFVLFYLIYMQTAEDSKELECSGLDENPNHIPNLRKIAEKAGLAVFTSEGYDYWGPKEYFLLQTFQDFVSPSVVEFLTLKRRDLEKGYICDGSLTLRFPELGERCVLWEAYVYGFPNSVMRVVALRHYERDLHALIFGAGYGAYPYDGQADVTSTGIDKEYLSVYRHIVKVHPTTPLADLLRKYLDLLSKSDTITKEQRKAFFAQYKALAENKDAYLPIYYCESCRSKVTWEESQRKCVSYAVPAVGVVDTESGKVTRVKYSNDGVAYPARADEGEFVFPCVWSSTTFYTMVATGRKTCPTNSSGKCQGPVQWAVREFDGQAHLLGTTPISQKLNPMYFDRHYLYDPSSNRVLGPSDQASAPNVYDGTVVGGPTTEGVATFRFLSSTDGGWVTAKSSISNSERLLFRDENLSRAGVSPDMRFVAAVLDFHGWQPSELRVIDTATGENKLLSQAGGTPCNRIPAWSPDSRTMAYPLEERFRHEVILIYSADTGELRKLVPDVCKEEGSIQSVLFLDANRLLYNHWRQKGSFSQWIAMDIATGKTLWTLRDRMEYVTVFDSGKKIACFFPEARR